MAPYPLADDGQRNFVDLNTIPNGVIDRIEVLRDSSSSTYGAHAIAGVINIITKKEIQRSEEHTSEHQSLIRTSYAAFFLTKKQRHIHRRPQKHTAHK